MVDAERARRAEHRASELRRAHQIVPKVSHEGIKLDQWFRRVGNQWAALPDEIRQEFHVELWPLIETEFKFAGHLARQQQQIDRLARQENRPIPGGLDFSAIPGLKHEARQRLAEIHPQTIGQAGRIPGITPADLAVLAVWLEKGRREKEG